jgi:hypothetical protein
MTTKALKSTLPSYTYLFPSEVAGAGYVVTSSGNTTLRDSWALVPGGTAPYNLAPVTAIAPVPSITRGQDATSSYASPGGDVQLLPGVGSVSNVSGNAVIKDTAGNGGTWNKSHLVLGIYHIWVDSTSRLRIKNSAPASDTDGTVVGTQS